MTREEELEKCVREARNLLAQHVTNAKKLQSGDVGYSPSVRYAYLVLNDVLK